MVVGTERKLKAYLERIKAGESSLLEPFLGAFANTVVFTPVVLFTDEKETGAKKVRVLTLNETGKKVVPTFSSEDLFLEWAADRYQCLPVTGADLAVTLPSGTSLRINPDQPESLELTPEQVERVGGEELPTDSTSMPDESAQQDSRTSTIGSTGSYADEFGSDIESDDERSGVSTISTPLGTEVRDSLSILFQSFPEIEEAYFVENISTGPEGTLGLLCHGLTVERRFLLISEIAGVSKQFYGFAGSIECFDDLNLSNTNSWELFKTLVPFYVRGATEPVIQDTGFLSGAGEPGTQDAESTVTPPKASTLWESLKRRRKPTSFD